MCLLYLTVRARIRYRLMYIQRAISASIVLGSCLVIRAIFIMGLGAFLANSCHRPVVPNLWPAGQKWPTKPQNVACGTRQIKKIKELNHRVFLTFNLFYLISIFDKHYSCILPLKKTCFNSCIIEFCTSYCTTCFIECQMLPNALKAGYIQGRLSPLGHGGIPLGHGKIPPE